MSHGFNQFFFRYPLTSEMGIFLNSSEKYPLVIITLTLTLTFSRTGLTSFLKPDTWMSRSKDQRPCTKPKDNPTRTHSTPLSLANLSINASKEGFGVSSFLSSGWSTPQPISRSLYFLSLFHKNHKIPFQKNVRSINIPRQPPHVNF